MISIIITAYKEPKTIGRAIDAILSQKLPPYEILLAAPDKETLAIMRKYAKKNKRIKVFKDPRKGKPYALNMLLPKAKGDILILTDGDVYVNKTAVTEVLKPFVNKKIGAVAARPISVNTTESMLGYWSHLLTDVGAHKTRLRRAKKKQFIICSGYLFAMRKLFTKIPEDALSDDAVMSHMVWKLGFRISYAPKAKVYVKYPTTFDDWILQKRRSAGGYKQIAFYFKNPPRMRTFFSEAFWGTLTVWGYPKSLKEMWYTLILFFARAYLWYVIKRDIKKEGQQLLEIWKPIETTK